MNAVAKIYLNEDGLLTFEALSNKVIEGKLYPQGEGKIGVVVIDTENNLEVSKDAVEPLRLLFENSITDGGDLGDIDFHNTAKGFCFFWIGNNKRVFKKDEKVYRAGGARFTPKFKVV